MPTCNNMCHSVPTWANIAVCQLCRERQPVWNCHDGLNLTCLDQCHGVHWLTPKNCYTGYSLDLIDEFTSLFSLKVIVAGLPRESFPTDACLCGHQCFSVFVQATQDAPKASPRKNFIEQVKLLLKWMLIERWIRPSMLSSMCQHVAILQFVSCAEKDRLSGTVMMAWIWHVWINAMVFVGGRQRIVIKSTV